MKDRILVWDLPTRIFHWTLVASFTGAFLTAESEPWRDVHVMLGYTVLGLVVFRLLWGLIGTRYARFAEFVRGPGAVLRYLKSLLSRSPEHHLGHNPAGALAILALLGFALLVGVSGHLLYADVGGEAFEELHEVVSYAMLAVVLGHVAGVVVSSVLHRENLVRAMIDGHKRGPREAGIGGAKAMVGVGLAAAVLGFWLWSVTAGDAAPVAVAASAGVVAGAAGDKGDD